MIGVRVEPEFRAEIKDAARRFHGGNESLLLRESARLYLDLRRKLGPQFEPFLHIHLGNRNAASDEAA